jgi:hypothetical protein
MTNILENSICSHCMRIKRFVQAKEPIYHAAGKSKKLVNLCLPPLIQNTTDAASFAAVDDSCCYFKYYQDLGLGLIVSDWQEQAYNAVLAVYISCPLLFLSLPGGSNNTTTIARRIERERERTQGEDKEGIGLRFDVAIRIAYNLPNNQILRQYLGAVNREKVPDPLDAEKNPRIWPIRYRMSYEEMRLVKTCDEPLTFRWNGI